MKLEISTSMINTKFDPGFSDFSIIYLANLGCNLCSDTHNKILISTYRKSTIRRMVDMHLDNFFKIWL